MEKTVSVRFPGVLALLGVLFVGLKLGGVIHWHWAWVLAPFWGPWVLALGLVAAAGVVKILTLALGRRPLRGSRLW